MNIYVYIYIYIFFFFFFSLSFSDYWVPFGVPCRRENNKNSYLWKQGKIIYFPAAAYADLYNLNKSSIQVTASPVASTVTIRGADGERGYEVIYIFDRFGLQKRIVRTHFEQQTIVFLVKEQDA